MWRTSYWSSGPESGKIHQMKPSISYYRLAPLFPSLPDYRTTLPIQRQSPPTSSQSYSTGYSSMLGILVTPLLVGNRRAGYQSSRMTAPGSTAAMNTKSHGSSCLQNYEGVCCRWTQFLRFRLLVRLGNPHGWHQQSTCQQQKSCHQLPARVSYFSQPKFFFPICPIKVLYNNYNSLLL